MNEGLSVPVQSKSLQLLDTYRERLQLLFGAEFSLAAYSSDEDGITLVNLRACSQESLQHAKEYVHSLCMPVQAGTGGGGGKTEKRVMRPVDVPAHRLATVIEDVERNCQAVVKLLDGRDCLSVTGPAAKVQLAADALLERFREHSDACQSQVAASAVDTAGQRSDKSGEEIFLEPSKIEFAMKLGYTVQLLQLALGKLGANASQNELLAELITLGSTSSPSPASLTATLERGRADPAGQGDSITTLPSPRQHSDLRPVVVDGSNVAMSHGGNKHVFSCRGIQLVVDWFRSRGHTEITVFVPQWRKETPRHDAPITDQEILKQLEKQCIVVFTPSRRIGGRRMICYDDRYIIKLATDIDGIVVSNDNYRDLISESSKFKEVIEKRLLMYSFVCDRFMPPDDPLGKNGPTLDKFLRKDIGFGKEQQPPACPYLKKCTYGNKCKYYHPERKNHPHKSVTEQLAEHAKTQRCKLRTSSTTEMVEGNGKRLLSRTKSGPAAKHVQGGLALCRSSSAPWPVTTSAGTVAPPPSCVSPASSAAASSCRSASPSSSTSSHCVSPILQSVDTWREKGPFPESQQKPPPPDLLQQKHPQPHTSLIQQQPPDLIKQHQQQHNLLQQQQQQLQQQQQQPQTLLQQQQLLQHHQQQATSQKQILQHHSKQPPPPPQNMIHQQPTTSNTLPQNKHLALTGTMSAPTLQQSRQLIGKHMPLSATLSAPTRSFNTSLLLPAATASASSNSHVPIARNMSEPSANLHKKLNRQLSLNPENDPRIERMRRVQPQKQEEGPGVQQVIREHQGLQRISSAPGCYNTPGMFGRDESGARSSSDTQLNLLQQQQQQQQTTTMGSSEALPFPQTSQVWPDAADESDWLDQQKQQKLGPIGSEPPPQTRPSQPENLDRERQEMFYHLSSIFPEDQVRCVMNRLPEERNAQKLCAMILALKNAFPNNTKKQE